MTKSGRPPEPPRPGLIVRIIRDERIAFLAVGAINTIVGFAIFATCSETIGHFVDQRFGTLAGTLVTIAIAHPLNVLFSFITHRRLVFRVRGHVLRDLLRFWSVYLTSISINVVALPVLMAGCGLDRIGAQALIMTFGALLSFFGHRNFSFRRTAAESEGKTSQPQWPQH